MSANQLVDGPRPDVAEDETRVARIALRFTAFSEKWLPDAFGFVLVGTVIVLLLGLATGEPLLKAALDPEKPKAMGLIDAWGAGFWSLITFTLQMSMIIIGGYAVASSAAVARKVPRADYRALGAMAFLGLGTVWAQGLSGSAALQVASASSSPKAVQDEIVKNGYASGLIPLSHTIFTWRALVATLLVFVVAVVMAWMLAPQGERARSAADLGIELKPLVGPGSAQEANRDTEGPRRPGDWLEHSPVLTIVIVGIGVVYLVRHFTGGNALASLDLNTINLILILLALLLNWRPWRMARAVREGAPAVSGVLLQFPLYGGIFGMIAYTGLSERIAGWLVQASSQFFFPPLIALYSMVLGVFVPSGGSKWVIEAPYVLNAAHQLNVDAGWMVVVYDLGEASANLLQPFWMLPVLAVLGLKARDIMGYTFAMWLVCFPTALIAVTLLAPHIGG